MARPLPLDTLRALHRYDLLGAVVQQRTPRCHGYHNGCCCTNCRQGPPKQAVAQPKQPWEPVSKAA